MDQNYNLGFVLRRKRLELGKTMKQVSVEIDVSESYICRVESNKRCNITLDIFKKFIKVYKLDVPEIMCILEIDKRRY
ncbi:helix-turn-helix domain-containing protein [Turicibacter sanguinis]|uniref:helix-turn-helix domain-containing protein n=1 Tax=Turicibacter sanguinis TaxID=154288 RepID=UPI0021D4BA88|nr:helix-turn-helix transcriptional regulator [Turicibacter sanguinis]MCU7192160.1 helix-turn-helix domain-containing protein [Turicibacter sanguinis]